MYFSKIEIENTGPIEHLQFSFPFNGDSPKPVIFVGRNGSGKSIVLSHLINATLIANSSIYEDAELESGKAYKLRSPSYILHGKHYSRAHVEYLKGHFVSEIQADLPKNEFEETYGFSPADKNWALMDVHETTTYQSDLHTRTKELKKELASHPILYFPPNRFEEPAWENKTNLKNETNYSKKRNIHEYIKFRGNKSIAIKEKSRMAFRRHL